MSDKSIGGWTADARTHPALVALWSAFNACPGGRLPTA
jgi:hypothetical protein